MEIELNSTFEDPGAYVAGDPDAEVSVLSNLDPSNTGVYEIRYSTTINGSIQELIRTVTVVEPEVDILETTISLDETTFSSLIFTTLFKNAPTSNFN